MGRNSGKPAAMTDAMEKGREKAWKGFADRYRPMMEECLAEECRCTHAERVIEETLGAVSRLLPHYRYCKGEEEAVRCCLRKMLRNRTVDKGKGWTCMKKAGRVKVTEELLAEVREFNALRNAAIELAVRELENSTKNKEHFEIFCRIGLMREKPAKVAKSLGATMAKVYQVKKRVGDRLKGIAIALFREVGLLEEQGAAERGQESGQVGGAVEGNRGRGRG